MWVNFNNILLKAFTLADPKIAKKTFNLTVFFALLGSGCVKAAHKMLVKLTPGASRLGETRMVQREQGEVAPCPRLRLVRRLRHSAQPGDVLT